MSTTCFLEDDPQVSLWRRGFVEALGTSLLVLAVAGSGATTRAFSHIPELDLIIGALSTAAALAGLIVAFGPISGGHFNPLITAVQWLSGERTVACTAFYCGSQLLGALLGALAVNQISGAQPRSANLGAPTWSLVASESLCSLGLMLVVFGCIRGGQKYTGPFAVAAWLTAAILATPSGSYANPAITAAAIVSRGPIAVSTTTACFFIAAQILGAFAAFFCISTIYPRKATSRIQADELSFPR